MYEILVAWGTWYWYFYTNKVVFMLELWFFVYIVGGFVVSKEEEKIDAIFILCYFIFVVAWIIRLGSNATYSMQLITFNKWRGVTVRGKAHGVWPNNLIVIFS
jgi:hypothetical protein